MSTAVPSPRHGRPDRPLRPSCSLHRRRPSLHRPPRRHPRLRPAGQRPDRDRHRPSTAAGRAASSPPASRSRTRWSRSGGPGPSVAEPMVPATVRGAGRRPRAPRYLSGLGGLDPADDHVVYDKKYVHTDVLVVGGGPAGLPRPREAAAAGARVILVDDQPELGGSLLSGRRPAETVDGRPALDWVADVEAELGAAPEVHGPDPHHRLRQLRRQLRHRRRRAAPTTSAPPPGRPAGVSRQRLWHIRAQQVVLATGAHERPLVFADNDRPGVMLASAVRTYLNRYAVAAGTRVVVATTNDSAYAMAADLPPPASRSRPSSTPGPRCPTRPAPPRPAGCDRERRRRHATVVGTAGDRRLTRRHRPASSTTTGELPSGTDRDRLRPGRRLRRLEPGRAPAQPAAGQAALGRRRSSPSCPPVRSRTSRSSAPPAAASPSTAAWPRASRAGRHAVVQRRVRHRGRRARRRRSAPRIRSRPAPPSRCGWSPAATASPADWRPPLRRPAARPDRRRRAARHRRRHAQRRAHQALHLDRHGQRPGQDVRRSTRSG